MILAKLPDKLLMELLKTGRDLKKWQKILHECLTEKEKNEAIKNNL